MSYHNKSKLESYTKDLASLCKLLESMESVVVTDEFSKRVARAQYETLVAMYLDTHKEIMKEKEYLLCDRLNAQLRATV